MTVMTSWDLFEDLRSAQDELLRMNRIYGQRLHPAGQFGQRLGTGAEHARHGLPRSTFPSARTPTW